jgi:hypothetical protein
MKNVITMVQGIEKQMKHIKNHAKNSLSIILNEYRNQKKLSLIPMWQILLKLCWVLMENLMKDQ